LCAQYQVWDTLQAFCSTVTGVFARQAILKSMGVGNANAAIGAALWQTVLRQNIGKVVRISFTTLKVPSTNTALLNQQQPAILTRRLAQRVLSKPASQGAG
jgi:hypothetical protein